MAHFHIVVVDEQDAIVERVPGTCVTEIQAKAWVCYHNNKYPIPSHLERAVVECSLRGCGVVLPRE